MSDLHNMDTPRAGTRAALLALLVSLGGCGGVDGAGRVFEPAVGDPGPRPKAYLNFPGDTYQAPRADDENQPSFPRLLSQTGAFSNVAELELATGLIPYDLQAPLWSDGAYKRRWIAIPELGEVRVDDAGPWLVPEGTVLVKHFEMQLDERSSARRKLETRLLVAARGGTYYGVTYKWNEAQTDAEIVLDAHTDMLSLVDAAGAASDQPYFYPGPRDCNTCHSAAAGYVLGLRTRQLNRDVQYQDELPPTNQLVAWSGWGFLDRHFDNTDAILAPRLANPADDSESLEQRVRSYWDGNCSMCHAGDQGAVSGWDARYFTPIEEQGLDQPPRTASPDGPARLIDPGSPEDSYIYVRGATTETRLRMPPIGRNKVDAAYVEVLQRWIESL